MHRCGVAVLAALHRFAWNRRSTQPMSQPRIVDALEPLEWVNVAPSESLATTPRSNDPEHQRSTPLIFTIHDGACFPRHLFGERTEEVLARHDVTMAHAHERDWGANLAAHHLARELGTGGYLRVNLARVVMDFGRFPGVSARGEQYLLRHSIFAPLQDLLDGEARHEILARYYDAISRDLVQHFAQRRITLGVHTYDRHNRSGTVRPELSLISRSLSYQRTSSLPHYIFDPLFPAILGESTSDRRLVYRMALALEHEGRRTALDYPYTMPEGSVEMRAQVWFFFRHLRQLFTRRNPETRDLPAFQRIWQMLLDVVRRSAEGERLRAYIHRYREAPMGSEQIYADARHAYEAIEGFYTRQRETLVEGYRFSPERPSTLGIEVRKDLLVELDDQRMPLGLRPDAEQTAADLARILAGAVHEHLAERAAEPPPAPLPYPADESCSDVPPS